MNGPREGISTNLRRALLALLVLLGPALLLPQSLHADEIDDIMAGFGDEEEDFFDDSEEESADPVDRWWDVTGSVGFLFAYNFLQHSSSSGTNFFGPSRLRTRAWLQLDADLWKGWSARASGWGFYDFLYLISGRDEYTEEVLDTYQWDAEIQELWLEGAIFRQTDAQLGRQVINWGRSDSLRVTDVLNPLDARDPGLTDVEDMLRPITAIRLDQYIGKWSFNVLVIPEIRYDKRPPYGSDFFPEIDPATVGEAVFFAEPELSQDPAFVAAIDALLQAAGGEGLANDIPDNRPDHWGEHPELGGSVTGIFSGWDFSLYAANYIANSGHIALQEASDAVSPLGLSIEYDRHTMVGSGGNLTLGSWLFKAELAWIDGFEFSFIEGVDLSVPRIEIGELETSRLDAMVGVEYYGINDLTIAFEIVNRHLLNYDPVLHEFPNYLRENTVESALRFTFSFLNDSLHATLLGVVNGIDTHEGSLVRIEADYELTDALEVSGGVLLFQAGDSLFFEDVGRNDRVFAALRYGF